MHRTTARFWKCFERLSLGVQDLAESSFALLKEDQMHPSLHFKKVGGFWSARIGMAHRALGCEDGDDFIWVWIGTHDEYMKMIKQGQRSPLR